VIYAHRRQLIKSALVSRCVLPLQYCDARDNARRARARARVADDKERQSQRKIRRSLVIFIYITNAACNTMRKARNIPSEKPCFFSFLIATADVRFPVEPELTRARALRLPRAELLKKIRGGEIRLIVRVTIGGPPISCRFHFGITSRSPLISRCALCASATNGTASKIESECLCLSKYRGVRE